MECDYCCLPSEILFMCPDCEQVYYCSETCQEASWREELHAAICPLLVGSGCAHAEQVDLSVLIEDTKAHFRPPTDPGDIGRRRKGKYRHAKRSRGRRKVYVSRRKAGKILRHGKVRGKRLTKAQRRYL